MSKGEQIEKLKESLAVLGPLPFTQCGLVTWDLIPVCKREGHHLIPDANDSYLCRYCEKRFIEKLSEQPK